MKKISSYSNFFLDSSLPSSTAHVCKKADTYVRLRHRNTGLLHNHQSRGRAFSWIKSKDSWTLSSA